MTDRGIAREETPGQRLRQPQPGALDGNPTYMVTGTGGEPGAAGGAAGCRGTDCSADR
jgi:hypothetical protein